MKDTSDGQDCHISDGDETWTVMHGYCRTRPETVGSPDAARNRSLVPCLRKAGSKLWEHVGEMQCFDVWSESSLCTCRRDNTTYSLFTAERFCQNLLHVLWKWSENKGFAFFSMERQCSSVSGYWGMMWWFVWEAKLDLQVHLVFN
jgi:hypothetical protein